MSIFAKRPLLLACAVFLAVSLLGTQLDKGARLDGLLICGSCALTTMVGILCFSRLRRCLFTILLCLLLGAGALWLSHSFFDRTLAPIEAQSESFEIEAVIAKANYEADYLTEYTANVTRLGDIEMNFSATLCFEGEVGFSPGDILTATVNRTESESGFYGFDERGYQLSHGVLLDCEVTDYEVIGRKMLPFFTRLRNGIAVRIDRAYQPEAAAMLKALLLGDKSELDTALKRDFRRLGISHILAISGTHFTVLLGLCAQLLRLLRLNKKQIYLLLVPAALLYMGISGFSASVCRAGIMALLTYLAFLLGRTRDAYTALFVAVCTLIAIHPYAVLDVGLWLSFTATFSILILSELFAKVSLHAGRGERLLSVLLGLLSRAAVTVVVFFGSLPITALYFGETSRIAPLANLLIVPLFEGFLYLAPFSVLFSDCAPLVCLTEKICMLICRAAAMLADRDDLLISLRQPLVLPIAICGVLLTLLLLTLKLKHPIVILLPMVLTIGALAVYIPCFHAESAKTNIAVFTAVGNNDGFLLLSGGETLYIDISTGASAPTRRAEWLAETLYDPELDGFLPTHYHMRHINTFNKLIARTHIKRLYLPPIARESDYNVRAALAAAAEKNDIEIVELAYDTPFDFENCTVSLTEPQMLKRSTHPVICLSIAADDDEILYLGSSFADTALDTSAMLENADFVILGQHAPITKHDFTLQADAVLLFAGDEPAEFADFPSEALLLPENGSYSYRFGKSK